MSLLRALPISGPLCSSVREVGLVCQWMQAGSALEEPQGPSAVPGQLLVTGQLLYPQVYGHICLLCPSLL